MAIATANKVLSKLPHLNAQRTRSHAVLIKAYFDLRLFDNAETNYARAIDNVVTHLGDSNPL